MAHIQRLATVEALTSYSSDATTVTKDLDIQAPITEITVGFQATGHGTGPAVDANIARTLTKIEIIDGSDIIWSLSGPLAVAHACYQNGVMPRRFDREDESVASRIRIPIRFGRYLGDEQLAFNPARFTNPQIKVTWNLAAIAAVGAGGYATTTAYLVITARVMEGAPAPSGLIIAKEIETWSSSASAFKYTDLPVDWPYRHLLMRSYKTKTGINAMVNKVKLSKNMDQFVFFDDETAELQRQLQSVFGPFHQHRILFAQHGDVLNSYFGDYAYATLESMTGNLNYFQIGAEGASIQIYAYDADAGTAYTTDAKIDCLQTGWNPENTMVLPVAIPGHEDDWVQFAPTDAVRLRTYELATGASITLAAIQKRTY